MVFKAVGSHTLEVAGTSSTPSHCSSGCHLKLGVKCNLKICWLNGPMRLMVKCWDRMWNILFSTLGGTHYASRQKPVIAHQGEGLISGHYVTLLVKGEAVWLADDGKCPEVHKVVPELIKQGAVMIWASRAEQSNFWSTTVGNFEPPTKKGRHPHQEIDICYANITQWTKDAKEWMIQQDHSIVMMVETHLNGVKLEAAHNDLCRHRWQPTLLEASDTGRGGNSGGHLFTVREGQSAYKLHSFDLQGNGFLANVLQRQQMELVLVTLYLKCGEDLNSQANATVLGQLAAFLQELATPWIVAGDFQVPPLQWEGHNLLNVLKAEVVCAGQPTMISGAEIDYVLASRCVAPFISIKVNWDVPWKPHAALNIKLDQEAPRLVLPQLTQYMAVPKLDDQVLVGQANRAKRNPIC